MVDSYRTDQFFNIENRRGKGQSVAGPGGLRQSGIDSDNPTNEKFAFPGPFRYVLGDDGKMEKVRVQRGFMRIIQRTKGVPKKDRAKNYRFFFQFNPLSIHRSVPMDMRTRRPLLQDPAELMQPLAGATSFAFEMMIDRSFEVNEPYKDIGRATRRKGRFSNDILSSNYPDTIGVLSDISMLDTVVGQKITEDLMEQVIKRQQAIANSGNTAEEAAAAFDADTFRQNYKSNIGNQAFLMPNPVRIVFSSLFMVDGYVTSMSVSYVRFNAAMVPITATVSVQMQAMYIGFAKPKTVLTENINNFNENAGLVDGGSTVDPNDENLDKAKKLIQDYLSTSYMYIGGTSSADPPDEVSLLKATSFENIIAFNTFPKLPAGKENDAIYQALSDQSIRGITVDQMEVYAWRKPYMDSEEDAVEGDNGTIIPLVRITKSNVWSATGTDAADTWFNNTKFPVSFYDVPGTGIDTVRTGPVIQGANAAYKNKDKNLKLSPFYWDKWQREIGNGKRIEVRGILRMTVQLESGNIPLYFFGRTQIGKDDNIVVKLALKTELPDSGSGDTDLRIPWTEPGGRPTPGTPL